MRNGSRHTRAIILIKLRVTRLPHSSYSLRPSKRKNFRRRRRRRVANGQALVRSVLGIGVGVSAGVGGGLLVVISFEAGANRMESVNVIASIEALSVRVDSGILR